MCKGIKLKEENLKIELVKRGNRYLVYFNGLVSRICWEIPKKNWDLIFTNLETIKSAMELYWYATV